MTAPCEQHRPGPAARAAARLGGRIPVLDTRRLQLRGPRIYDFDAYAKILCSARAEHMGGPFSRAEAWGDFTNYSACWLLHGFGLWTIDAATQPTAGFALVGFEYEDPDPEPELGIFLSEEAEGAGIATEALTAVRTHAFEDFGLDSLVSYVAPANDRCIALMTGLGAVRDTVAEALLGDDTLVFRHKKEVA